MQELQKKFGPDKFQVLLISVDADYGGSVKEATSDVRATLAKHHINWPTVVEPKGWNGIHKTWNLDGYQLTLIDQNGRVVKSGYLGDELEGLLTKLIKH